MAGRGIKIFLKGLRIIGLILLVNIIFILILLMATVLIFKTPPGQTWFRHTLEQQAQKVLPGFKVNKVAGNLFNRLSFEGVTLRDRFGGEAIRVQRLNLHYQLVDLLFRTVHFSKIAIEQPQVLLKPAQNGKLNVTQLLLPRREEKPSEKSTWTIRIDQFDLGHGKVEIVREISRPISLSDIALAARATIRSEHLQFELDKLQLQGAGILPKKGKLTSKISGIMQFNQQQLGGNLQALFTGITPAGDITLAISATGPLAKLNFSLEGKVDQGKMGRLKMQGWISTAGLLAPQYNLFLEFQHFNTQRVLAEIITLPLGLDLAAKISGQGIPLSHNSQVNIDLQGKPGLQLERWPLSQFDLQGTLHGSAWRVNRLHLTAAGAKLHASGHGNLSRFYANLQANIPNLSLLPLPASLGLKGKFNFVGTVQGPFSGDLLTQAQFSANALTVAGVSAQHLAGKAQLTGIAPVPWGNLHLEIDQLSTPTRFLSQRAQLVLEASSRQITIDLQTRGKPMQGRLRALARLAPGYKKIEIELKQMHWSGLLPSAVALRNRPQILIIPERLIQATPIHLTAFDGNIVLQGAFRPTGFPRIEAQVQFQKIRPPLSLTAHPIPLSLNGSVKFAVDRKKLTAQVQARLPAQKSSLWINTQLPLRYRARDSIPTLANQGPSVAKLQGKNLDLALLNLLFSDLPPVGGNIDLDLSANGPINNPQIKIDLALRQGKYRNLVGLNGTLALKTDEQESLFHAAFSQKHQDLFRMKAHAASGLGVLYQAINGQRLLASQQHTPFQLDFTLFPASILLLQQLDPRLKQIQGSILTQLHLQGPLDKPRADLQITAKNLQVNQRQWGTVVSRLQTQMQPGLSEGTLTLALNRETILQAQARADARLSDWLFSPKNKLKTDHIPLRVKLSIPTIAVDRFRSFHESLSQIAGYLGAELQITGTMSSPQAKATLKLTGLHYGQIPVGDITAGVNYNATQLKTNLQIRQPGGGWINSQGQISWPTADNLQFKLQGKDLDLAFVHFLSPAISDSAGKLNLSLSANGKLLQPVIQGQVKLNQGVLNLRGLTNLTDLNLKLDFNSHRVALTALNARSGSGQVTATGEGQFAVLDFTKSMTQLLQSFTFRAEGKNFPMDVASLNSAQLSGNIIVHGQLQHNELKTQIRLEKGVLKIAKIGGQRHLPDDRPLEDVIFVETSPILAKTDQRTQKASLAKKPASLPVKVTLSFYANPLFIRGEDLDLEAFVDLHAPLDRQGHILLEGKAGIRRGELKILDNTFEIRRAILLFTGQATPDPSLNILLARKTVDAILLVGVTGTLSSPELSLSSDPPIYARAQILNILMGGRPEIQAEQQADGMGKSSSDYALMVGNIVSNLLLGNIAKNIGSKIGFDVAKVKLEIPKGQVPSNEETPIRGEVEIGKYLTERIYLAYHHIMGATENQNNNEGLLEYRISIQWLVSVLFGDKGIGSLDVYWNYRY